ncbi:centrosomal protein of 70 kDa isoform X2 [Engystomops pustulosus]|uniref:centrosomal protein of 70 kDa isoform X2 n=1 Tax=Engystomops pustulosus TaxID=76066 RepID=UPI003AFAD961
MRGAAGEDQMELAQWENINKLLKRHGCRVVHVSLRDDLSGAVSLDPQASLALRAAIQSLVEDTERRQNLIHGLIQDNKRLKDEVQMQQDRAGRQEQRASDLQRILDGVKVKIRDLEDDFMCKMRQQQSEVTGLLQEKATADKQLREQEKSIAHLRRRLTQEKRSHQDQEKLELLEDPVLERNLRRGSPDLDPTPNYKALIKSYQEQIEGARRKEEELLRENSRLREETRARPTVGELRIYKQQMRKMEKILRGRGATREKEESKGMGVRGLESLPYEECHRYLQDVCRALEVQNLENLLPVVSSTSRKAKTCVKLQEILTDIRAVLCGPRAPPLLYKMSSRLQEHPDPAGETDFLHLLPTVEMWAGQLLALQTLQKSLMKLRQKLRPPLEDRTSSAPDSVRVEDLLLLVDTMLEDSESQGSGAAPHVLQAQVSHFQQLFDVESVRGVIPRMNQIYSKLGEMSNAMKSLRHRLGLGDGVSAGSVVMAVEQLQQIVASLDMDSIVTKMQEHEDFFPAFEELIKELLQVLEIGLLQEILPEVKRLKALATH